MALIDYEQVNERVIWLLCTEELLMPFLDLATLEILKRQEDDSSSPCLVDLLDGSRIIVELASVEELE